MWLQTESQRHLTLLCVCVFFSLHILGNVSSIFWNIPLGFDAGIFYIFANAQTYSCFEVNTHSCLLWCADGKLPDVRSLPILSLLVLRSNFLPTCTLNFMPALISGTTSRAVSVSTACKPQTAYSPGAMEPRQLHFLPFFCLVFQGGNSCVATRDCPLWLTISSLCLCQYSMSYYRVISFCPL